MPVDQVRVGVITKRGRRLNPRTAGGIYGGGRLTPETLRKSLTSEPVDYGFDNRKNAGD